MRALRLSEQRFFGCGTALVTPFTRDGELDEHALRGLVDWQMTQGVHFLVPGGSTGEAATLSPAEQRRVVELVAEQAAGRVPIVAGAGSSDTRQAITLSKELRAAGATHLLHVLPTFSRPPQRGILAHFRAIADAVDLPIILHNVPACTGSNIEVGTTLALAEDPRIIGINDASGDLAQIMAVVRERPPRFGVLSGDDALTLAIMAAGGDGVVSVVSNVTPRLMAYLVERCHDGDFVAARALHEQLVPWMHAAVLESDPIPVKAALAMLGRIENVLRLPLVPLAPDHERAVRASLAAAGAIS